MHRSIRLLVSLPLMLTACPRDTPPTVNPAPPAAIEPASEPSPVTASIPKGPLRYHGTVELPVGDPLEFFVELEPGEDGHTGTITIPTQGAFDAGLRDIVVAEGELAFTMSGAGARWTATLTSDGQANDCRLEQGGVELSCALDPIDEAALAEARSPTRPQTPTAPFPYDTVDVEYDNTTDGVHLAGTITLPKGPGPYPAALLITGSGAQDRDESLLGHKPFLVLADHLTRQGIAVLRVDDRGMGGSTGKLSEATGEALARDVATSVAHLRAHPRVAPDRVGLIGHSEGGVLGPRVASEDPTIAFVVMMAGTGVPGHEIVREQAVAILRAKGHPAATIELARHQQAKLLQIVLDNEVEIARPKLEEILGAGAQADMMLSPWYRSFIAYDPRPALEKLRCPVLVLNGELDLQVLPDQNLPMIEKALAKNRKRTTVHRLPGLNHLFQHAKTGNPEEYATIDETIAPEVLPLISEWVVTQTSGRKAKAKAKKAGR